MGLVPAVERHIARAHDGATLTALDDLFVVKVMSYRMFFFPGRIELIGRETVQTSVRESRAPRTAVARRRISSCTHPIAHHTHTAFECSW